MKLIVNTLLGFLAITLPVSLYGGLTLLGRHYVFVWHQHDHRHDTDWIAALIAPALLPLLLWGFYSLGKAIRYEIRNR